MPLCNSGKESRTVPPFLFSCSPPRDPQGRPAENITGLNQKTQNWAGVRHSRVDAACNTQAHVPRFKLWFHVRPQLPAKALWGAAGNGSCIWNSLVSGFNLAQLCPWWAFREWPLSRWMITQSSCLSLCIPKYNTIKTQKEGHRTGPKLYNRPSVSANSISMSTIFT